MEKKEFAIIFRQTITDIKQVKEKKTMPADYVIVFCKIMATNYGFIVAIIKKWHRRHEIDKADRSGTVFENGS